MNRIIYTFIVLFLFNCTYSNSYIPSAELIEKAEELGSPQSIYDWISSEIDYEITEYWQNPDVTLERKKGDCGDVSWLGTEMLRVLGYQSYILVGKNKYNKNRHAVTLFRESEGWRLMDFILGWVRIGPYELPAMELANWPLFLNLIEFEFLIEPGKEITIVQDQRKNRVTKPGSKKAN